MSDPTKASQPAVELIAWLDSVDSAVREDLSVQVYLTCPFANRRGSMSDVPRQFRELVLQPQPSTHKELGKIVCLRALIERVVAGRDSQADWDESMRENDVLRLHTAFKGELDLADTIERNMSSLPERAKLWISAGESWRSLTASSLSDAALKEWFLAQRGP